MERPAIAVSVDMGTTLPLLRSGGHPACRGAGASRPADEAVVTTNRAEIFQNRTHLHRSFRAAGRQPSTADETSAATTPSPLFPRLRQNLPKLIGTAINNYADSIEPAKALRRVMGRGGTRPYHIRHGRDDFHVVSFPINPEPHLKKED